MKRFNNFIDSANLIEIPLSNGRFTWSREGISVARSLIDRFFINKEWDEIFENTRASRQPRTFSDYFPLLLEAGLVSWGPSPFRFCNSWILNKECDKIINGALKDSSRVIGWAGFVLSMKLRAGKTSVKAWHNEYVEKQKWREEKLLEEIDKLDEEAETLTILNLELDRRYNLGLNCSISIGRKNEILFKKVN